MANLWLKNILGQIPATEKLEASRNQLNEDHKRFQQIGESEDLQKYYELKAYTESDEFLQRRKELESIQFKGSEEEQLLNEYKKLQKDKALVRYFKTLDSTDLKRFREIEKSEKLARFNEIKETVEGGQIEELKKQMDADHQAELDKNKHFKKLQKNAQLKKYFKLLKSPEFIVYKDLKDSDMLREYNDLKQKTGNFDYSKITKENKADYADELNQKARFNELKKDNKLKQYFKFIKARHPEFIENTAEGDLLKEYESLKVYLASDEYTEKLKATDFRGSDLYQLQQEFRQLQKDDDIRFYQKFKNSKDYKNYLEINESDKLARFNELKARTENQEFIDRVNYLKDNKKFEKTEDYQKLQEFNKLKNSENIKWYFRVKDEDRFRPLREWETIFEEHFENNKLNDAVWSPVIFAGLISINDNYVTHGEKQFFTKGENIHIDEAILRIETRKEQARGKAWSPRQGFTDQQFDYTSGTLNTAKGFRFNKGKIEAKISVQQSNQIVHGFSLKGERITPHIDLMKTGKGTGYQVRYIPDSKSDKAVAHDVKGININNKYYIYALHWDDKELIWYLNNIEVAREPHQLSTEELFINLASILEKTPENLPASFKIDWIKIAKPKQGG